MTVLGLEAPGMETPEILVPAGEGVRGLALKWDRASARNAELARLPVCPSNGELGRARLRTLEVYW